MYKCLYDLLKTACNATASAIYTTYHVALKNRWFATKNCTISECSLYSSENLAYWLFGTADVDRVIRSLKHGKAADLDGISVEHLTYSHPSLISHLRKLFNLI